VTTENFDYVISMLASYTYYYEELDPNFAATLGDETLAIGFITELAKELTTQDIMMWTGLMDAVNQSLVTDTFNADVLSEEEFLVLKEIFLNNGSQPLSPLAILEGLFSTFAPE
jgi:hypothetical protein